MLLKTTKIIQQNTLTTPIVHISWGSGFKKEFDFQFLKRILAKKLDTFFGLIF